MNIKISNKKFIEIINEEVIKLLTEEGDPLAISVLGAPAAGKTYTRDLIGKIAKRFQQATDTGKNLTVDVIRDEFLSKSADERLPEFFKAFYTLKDFGNKNPKFQGWFTDLQDLWNGKLSQLIEKETGLKYSADNSDILVDGRKTSLEEFVSSTAGKEEAITSGLHPYHDQKRVVRHLQLAQSEQASSDKQDVMYDETGDEPSKMITRLNRLHKMGYITDTILVHPSSVVVNLLQNASRMIDGSDGGRDSSSSIVSAYNAIDQGKSLYSDEAEVSVQTTSDKLSSDADVQTALGQANVEDDAEMGDKPIDVFIQVDTQSVTNTYGRIAKGFSPAAELILKSILIVQVNDSGLGVSPETQEELSKSIPDLPSLDQAKQAIAKVKDSQDPQKEFGQPMTGVLSMQLQEQKKNIKGRVFKTIKEELDKIKFKLHAKNKDLIFD